MATDSQASPQGPQEKKWNVFRTLYLLLGGSGAETGMYLRKQTYMTHGVAVLPFQRYLWVDTDFTSQSKVLEGAEIVHNQLKYAEHETVPLKLGWEDTHQYLQFREQYPWLWEWLDPELLENLGSAANTEAGAAQIRPLGRLAFTHSIEKMQGKIDEAVNQLFLPDVKPQSREKGFELEEPLEIVLVASLAGGTGSGTFIEVARWAFHWARKLRAATTITSYLYLPSVFSSVFTDKLAAFQDIKVNAYAALQELNDLSSPVAVEAVNLDTAKKHRGRKPRPLAAGGIQEDSPVSNPFSEVYLISSSNGEVSLPGHMDAYAMVADALFVDLEPSNFGSKKRADRCNRRPSMFKRNSQRFSVQDRVGTENLQYVMEFPLNFGRLGIARAAFFREQWQRAGAALLAQKMLLQFTGGNRLGTEQISRLIAETGDGLNPASLAEKLLLSGQGGPIYSSILQSYQREMAALREEASQALDTTGMKAAEQMRALLSIKQKKVEWQQRAQRIRGEAVAAVTKALQWTGMVGEHARALQESQRRLQERYDANVLRFTLQLFSNPDEYGYAAAVEALEHLERQLIDASQQSVEPDLTAPPPAPLHVELSPDAAAVFESMDRADSMWLPIYAQIARGYYQDEAKKRLRSEIFTLQNTVMEWFAALDREFERWLAERYRAEAAKRSKDLYKSLATGIAARARVEREGKLVEVTNAGLLSQLSAFHDELQRIAARFEKLSDFYRGGKTSTRNFEVDAQGVFQEIHQHLAGAWESFLAEEKAYIAAGDQHILSLGAEQLIKQASAKPKSAKYWVAFADALNRWTVRYLTEKGYLDTRTAQEMLDSQTAEALIHLKKTSASWLSVQEGGVFSRDTQRTALLGAADPDDPAVVEAYPDQSAGIFKMGNGSLVAYQEQAIFPLHVITELDDLKNVHDAQFRERPKEYARRYTVREPLELPHIILPKGSTLTQAWFEAALLALQATTLGLFATDRARPIWKYRTAQHVTHAITFAPDLRAVAAKLALHAESRQALGEKVEEAWHRALESESSAIAFARLLNWYQNGAFEAPKDDPYLEHEVARSLYNQFRVAMERSGYPTPEFETPDLPTGEYKVSPVTSRYTEMKSLYTLQTVN